MRIPPLLTSTKLLGALLFAALSVAADRQGMATAEYRERSCIRDPAQSCAERVQELAPKCNRDDGNLYIAFFGGAGDDWESSKLIERLADEWRRHYLQYVVKYYTWNMGATAIRELHHILKNCPHKNSKVLLIGHSWGGDTAYDVAQDMHKYSVALITLDPVSKRAWRTYGVYPLLWLRAQRNNIPNPTSRMGTWVNVHAHSSGGTDIGIFPLSLIGWGDYLSHSPCNATAAAGGPWGRQRNADQDYTLARATSDGGEMVLTHCHVGRMLFQSFKDTDVWTAFFGKHEVLPVPEFYPEDE